MAARSTCADCSDVSSKPSRTEEGHRRASSCSCGGCHVRHLAPPDASCAKHFHYAAEWMQAAVVVDVATELLAVADRTTWCDSMSWCDLMSSLQARVFQMPL